MSTTTRSPLRDARSSSRPLPIMRVTPFDRVSSFLLAAVLASIVTVIGVLCWWYALRPANVITLVPLEPIAGGGFEDGSLNDTLRVESPEAPNPHAASAVDQADQPRTDEALAAVVELSDRAAEQAQQLLAQEETGSGTPGSIRGTGRPLGEGPGPDAGTPRENRWFVKFADDESLQEYARQLDWFAIELGVFYPERSVIAYVSQLAQAVPSRRLVTTASAETRLFMTWVGGQRQAADRALLQKAGLDPAGGIVLQFYPAETEALLAEAERSYAHRAERDIRRTYFVIVPRGDGYAFAVTRQTYWR